MAITTVNAVWLGTGPTKSGQILAEIQSGSASRALEGYATATGDASTSTFTVNFIDGTELLSFTPAMILCGRVGGAATGTIQVVSCVPTVGSETKSMLVTADGTINAATFIVGFRVLKA